MKNIKNRNAKGDDGYFCVRISAPGVRILSVKHWAGYNKTKAIGKQAQQYTQNAHCWIDKALWSANQLFAMISQFW